MNLLFEGVPQGSMLSPKFFILAMNRLARILPSKFSVLCKWMTLLFGFPIQRNMMVRKITRSINKQCGIMNFISWFKTSATKTVAMTFTRKRKVPNIQLDLYNHPIKFVTHTKFLGLYLDQRMTWKHYINHLRDKCDKTLASLNGKNTEPIFCIYIEF